MQLIDYVEKNFGGRYARKLQNIRRGGDNNRKGDSFETYYAAAKVCEIAAQQQQLDDFFLSSQDLAFVDDLCLRQVSASYKENYQAKNSSGDAASWNADIEDRFRMQIQIDIDVHECSNNRQVLLVSSEVKAVENNGKIPEDLRDSCVSEFFPYHPKSTQILYRSPALRGHLEKICDTTDLSDLDAAFRYVVSAWICNDARRTVGDIIGDAKAMSKPNVFGALVQERPVLPDWIHRLCMAFQGLEARVEFGRFIVSYNGFEVSLGTAPTEPEHDVLAGFSDVGQVFAFLMSKAQKELEDA